MQFSDVVNIGAPRERVWTVLMDPYTIGPCVPGLTDVEVYDGGTSFGGQASIRMGSTALTFPTRVTWVEQNAPQGGRLLASAVLAGYEIEGRGNIVLAEGETGETALAWDAAVIMPAKLAENPIMVQMVRMFATRFIEGFFQCVQARLETV